MTKTMKMTRTMEATNVEASAAVEILAKPYARRLTPEPEGGYSATISEFPGLVAEGETAEDALKNLDEAAASWVEVSLAHGRAIREPVSFNGYSGKISLRIPRTLHRQVAELADLDGASVNQMLTQAIAEFLGRSEALHKVSEAMQVSLSALQERQSISRFHWQFASEANSIVSTTPALPDEGRLRFSNEVLLASLPGRLAHG